EPDELIVYLVIITDIAGRAHEAFVAARARDVLPQFGEEAAGRIFVVVKGIIPKRVAEHRGHEWALCFLERQGSLAVRQAVEEERGRTHARRPRQDGRD